MSTGVLGSVVIERLGAPGVCWNMTDRPHGATMRVHYPFTTRDYCRDDLPVEYRDVAEALPVGHRKEVGS